MIKVQRRDATRLVTKRGEFLTAGTYLFNNYADDFMDRVRDQMYNQEVCYTHCRLNTEPNPAVLKIILVS